MTTRVLVVDDDEEIRASLVDALVDDHTAVTAARSAEAALAALAERAPDIVLSDIRMPGLDGIELLRTLKERAPSVDVVLMTAYDDMQTVVSAMREGAADFLSKPLDLHELRKVLVRVVEDRRIRERSRRRTEDETAAYRLDQLVGRDPKMIEVYKLVGQLAANRATVLIRGETGTGKELIARAIHYNSTDAEEPFIPINCTAIPGELLESELFGHVRGAFTGAVADRKGRFALAGRGTVFLDEIGDTSPEFQAKLLRVLERGDYYPVGAEKAARTEARVIAATHRDLEKRCREGAFREDLYYRLRVVEVSVPPLRDRLGDLPILAEHLVKRAAEDLHRPPPVISEEALEALLGRDWPGNVRELENALTRALVLSTGDVIRVEHLAARASATEVAEGVETLAEVERRQVQRAIEATGGNKSKAARLLDISRPRLDRLLDKYSLR